MRRHARTLVLLLLAFTFLPGNARSQGRSHDRWVELPPPARAEHTVVFDARHRRLIAFGGSVAGTPRNDLWILSTVGQARWNHVEPSGDVPAPRAGAAAVFDEERERLLVFGGRGVGDVALDDLWELSLRGHPRWRRLGVTGSAPDGRWGATFARDPQTGTFVLFGGRMVPYFGLLADLWEFDPDLGGWRTLNVSGTRPDARAGHSMVFSPDARGFLVFGGEVRRVVPNCFGCTQPEETDEIWLLGLGATPSWQRVELVQGDAPCRMQGHAAAWDEQAGCMIVFGGRKSWQSWEPCPATFAATWAFSWGSQSWSLLSPGDPALRSRGFAAASFESATRTLFIHGGVGRTDESYADTWRLDLKAETLRGGGRSAETSPRWTLIAPDRAGPVLSPMKPAPAVWDPRRRRIVMDTGDRIVTFDADRSEWSEVRANPTPPARAGNIAILDSRRDRMVIFGGQELSYPFAPIDAVWELSLGDPPKWTKLDTRGGPPPTHYGSAIYDPLRDRLLLFAVGWFSSQSSGVWALPFSGPDANRWTMISSALGGAPGFPQVQAATAVYDLKRDRLIIACGGQNTFDGWWRNNGCWALELADDPRWTELFPGTWNVRVPGQPSPRTFATGVYDASADRLIIAGGTSGGYLPDDAWSFSFDDNGWRELTVEGDPHPGWMGAAATYDPQHGRIYVQQHDVVWALESGRSAPGSPHRNAMRPEGAVWLTDAHLRGARPNPSTGDLSVEFTLPDATPAALELVDLSGRRVWHRNVGALGAGSHAVPVEPGLRLEPGIYFLRLERAGEAQTTKVIRLRR